MSEQFIDPRELRKALGTFMTGVTVTTTIDAEDRPRGFPANLFTSVALEPPLVLVCIDHNALSYPVYAETEHFAVNVLAEEQREVSGIFAGKTADKFSYVSWNRGLSLPVGPRLSPASDPKSLLGRFQTLQVEAEKKRSIELFIDEVMPACARPAAAGQPGGLRCH